MLMWALLALAGLQVASCLKVAAFNIRTFGETKMSNATLVNYIVQIVSRYDIALIQEVRDSHLTAVGKLLDNLNKNAADTYRYVVSDPLGRSTYKERYLFVYRQSPGASTGGEFRCRGPNSDLAFPAALSGPRRGRDSSLPKVT